MEYWRLPTAMLVLALFALPQTSASSAELQPGAQQGQGGAGQQLRLPTPYPVLVYGSRGYESPVYPPSAYGPPTPEATASPLLDFYANAFGGGHARHHRLSGHRRHALRPFAALGTGGGDGGVR